jgi:hypothetical protein
MSLEAWGDEPWGAEDGPDIERLLGEGYRPGEDMTKAAHDVLDERLRQRDVEGWTPEHDDATYETGEMAHAASSLAYQASRPDDAEPACPTGSPPADWPWDATWWKRKGRRNDLVRAAALLLAEIERLDRAEAKAKQVQP